MGCQGIQLESQEQIFSSGRISVENHTSNWIEEQSVWQVVTKLEGSLQSDQSHIWQFLYARDIAR